MGVSVVERGDEPPLHRQLIDESLSGSVRFLIRGRNTVYGPDGTEAFCATAIDIHAPAALISSAFTLRPVLRLRDKGTSCFEYFNCRFHAFTFVFDGVSMALKMEMSVLRSTIGLNLQAPYG